jgi:hypothetical protein
MRRQLLMALLSIVFSHGFGPTPVGAEAAAVDLTGTWGLEYRGSEGPIKLTFVFKQEGEKLTGDYSGPFGDHKVIGRVKGNQVAFGFDLKGPMATITVTFKGTIESATKMTGTVGNPFCGSAGCKWTGAKKK